MGLPIGDGKQKFQFLGSWWTMISKIMIHLFSMDLDEILGSRAVREVFGSLLLRIGNRILQIVVSIMVARLLPLNEFGLFSIVISTVMVFQAFSIFGTPQFVQREIAIATSQQMWDRIKSLMRWSSLIVTLVSIAILLTLYAWECLGGLMLPENKNAFAVGILIIPTMAFLQLWQAQLRGYGSIIAGQIPETLVKPVLFILFVFVAISTASFPRSATFVLALQLIATICSLGLVVYLKHLKMGFLKVCKVERASHRNWLWSSSRFALLSGLAIFNNQIGILMVGVMSGKADAGVFTVAVKGANLLVVALMAANIALSPRMAKFYNGQRYDKLQKMITRGYRAVALVTLPVFLLFVFGGKILLSIFGPAFVIAWPSLVILSFGQYLFIIAGPVGTMLSMAGHERVTAFGVAVSVVVIVGLGLILIPTMGVLGAAIATATGMVTWNVLLVALCYKRLGIWTPAIGIGFVRTMWKRN